MIISFKYELTTPKEIRLGEIKDGWHRADILAAISKKGSSLAGIGREIGLQRSTMSWALIGPHPRANAAIAEFIGVALHDLWPQWFDEDGKLISTAKLQRPRAKPMTGRRYESSPRRHAA